MLPYKLCLRNVLYARLFLHQKMETHKKQGGVGKCLHRLK